MPVTRRCNTSHGWAWTVRAWLQAPPPKYIPQSFNGRHVHVTAERVGLNPLVPVSMSPVSAGQFLVANYSNIYLLDTKANTARIVHPEPTPPVWNPTSVHYSPYYDRAFIANYTGDDIIIARIQDDGTLRIEEHLRHPTVVGPENVYVTPGGRYLATANYVGNSVSLFERIDSAWQFRWSAPVSAAHGVTIVGDAVYAGGSTIVAKFDIATGHEMNRLTAPIQFATCVNHDEQSNGLIVADTIAGRIYTMDLDLTPTNFMGSNGPTLANLSMPYCAYRDREATWILSTYQERIIRIDGAVTSFEMKDEYWPYLMPHTFASGSWSKDRPSVSMFGRLVRPAYGGLTAMDGAVIPMPRSPYHDGKAWTIYLTSIAKDGDWVIMATVSSPIAMLYNQRTNEVKHVSHGEFDCWASDVDLMCPSRRYSSTELLAKSESATGRIVSVDGGPL